MTRNASASTHNPPHPFAGTRKRFKIAAGEGQFYSLPELAKTYPNIETAAGIDPHRAGIGAAQLRRQEGPARACGAARQLAAERAAQRRDPLRRRARGAAGLHRRAAAGRPGRHAQRGRGHGQGRQGDRAAGAGGPGGRPLGDGRSLRQQGCARPEHEAGVPAQPRALPVHEVGHAGLRHLRRGAARLRHRAPGQPGVPGARRAQRQGRRVLPRHAGRHRQPHHDDQRHRRGRLGRRRHRGRGRHAGPAGVLPDARRGRHEAHRPPARRLSPPPTWCSP